MVELSDLHLIGQGKNRRCYRHPHIQNRCIKILREKSPIKTQQRETRYFRHLFKRGVNWDMVTPLLEEVSTNLGNGVVFELMLDFNGEISKTLDYYINQNNPELNNLLISEIEHLKAYLLQQNIVFRDLNPLNMVLQQYQPRQFRLMVIDGIGHNDFIPFCHFSKWYGQKKIRRTWNRKMNYWFACYSNLFDSITPY